MIKQPVASVDVRSPPTISPDTVASEAAQLLCRSDVPALVVREDDAVVGVVTDADVVAMVAETDGRPPVRTFMSTPATTISSSVTLQAAAERMRTAGVRHLPVVDDGVYHGLLSASTLAPYLSRRRLEIEPRADPTAFDSRDRPELTADD